jgi:hypothetical protein
MTTRECPVCDRPVRDTVLCTFCTSEIVKCLIQVPDLMIELEVNSTRQSVTAPRASGGRSAETPLPFGARASDAAKQLTDVLRFWAGSISNGTQYTALTAATYLRTHINALRQHAMAEKAYDQITGARAHAFEVIDRPTDLVPAGQCGVELDDGEVCLEILYGDPERSSVRCRCGAEHPMDRAWMLTAARDQELTAAEIGRITPGVTGAMVRGYAKRNLLPPVGVRKLGPERTIPTYRVGDLLDLLTRQTKEAS